MTKSEGVHANSDITTKRSLNDAEYVCAFCRKICRTKTFLELHLKAAQHHAYDVPGEDESEAENVDEVEDASVIPEGSCLIPCR